MKAVVTQLDGLIGYISDESRRVYKFEYLRFVPEAYVGMPVIFYPNNEDDEWVHLICPATETAQQAILRQIEGLIKDMSFLRDSIKTLNYPTEEEMADMANERK